VTTFDTAVPPDRVNTPFRPIPSEFAGESAGPGRRGEYA